jgi:hypothetical protein
MYVTSAAYFTGADPDLLVAPFGRWPEAQRAGSGRWRR